MTATSPLQELLTAHDSGIWSTEDDADGVSILRSTNFRDDGELDFCSLAVKAVGREIVERKVLRSGDILLEKSGGGPNKPVGRVCIFRGDERPHVCGNFIARLRADTSKVEPEYLFQFLWQFHRLGRTLHFQKQTTGIRNLETKRFLQTSVPLPPLDEQRRIVDLLNRASSLKRLAEQAQANARELIPALFVEMFGTASTRWPVAPLSEVSQIRSGITKGRKAKGPLQAVPYLRVANVQDGHLDLSTIKEIEATAEEISRYALAPGDLLLTEGGDPDKLGRGAVWAGEVQTCIHQNHVFAVRVDPSQLLPAYAAAVAGSGYGKAYFLSVAKRTTGIASINKTQLGRFPMPVPPIELQREFATRVQEVKSIGELALRAADAAEQTSAALMSRLFAG